MLPSLTPLSRLLRPKPRFRGGLPLDGHSAESTRGPILKAPMPPLLVLSLKQQAGVAAQPLVKAGERVLSGQPLARVESALGLQLHAPAAGRVLGFEDRLTPHPSGLPSPCILLEVDGDEAWDGPPPLGANWFQASRAELFARFAECGIVGLGGAVFPLSRKVDTPAPLHTLILNGSECEPYISCDEALMKERAAAIVEGGAIVARAAGCSRILIGLEGGMPEAAASMRQALDQGLTGGIDCSLQIVDELYPSGGEKQLIYLLTGTKVPSGGVPRHVGMLCINVATAYAARQAAVEGRPLTRRIVTIGGNIARPANVEAALGTPIEQLIELCGGYSAPAASQRLIMGGPMMGIALTSSDLPVTKGTNCILALDARDAPLLEEARPCIRCGACADSCPVDLLPQQLYWHSRNQDFANARAFHLFDCIECGCCSYVCPSKIPLVQYFRYAKSEIHAATEEEVAAKAARQRFDAREQRLEKQRQERADRAERRREELKKAKKDGSKQKLIAEALKRAEKHRAELGLKSRASGETRKA